MSEPLMLRSIQSGCADCSCAGAYGREASERTRCTGRRTWQNMCLPQGDTRLSGLITIKLKCNTTMMAFPLSLRQVVTLEPSRGVKGNVQDFHVEHRQSTDCFGDLCRGCLAACRSQVQRPNWQRADRQPPRVTWCGQSEYPPKTTVTVVYLAACAHCTSSMLSRQNWTTW